MKRTLVLGAILTFGGAGAQTPTAPATPGSTTTPFVPILDLSTPTSAAQSLLGLDPSKVDTPSTFLTGWGLGLLQGAGTGAIGTGASLSMSLMQIFDNGHVDATDYLRNDFFFRITHYMQFSGATVAGDGSTSPGKAALGVAIPLTDNTDWKTDNTVRKAYVDGFKPALDALDAVSIPRRPVQWEDGESVANAKVMVTKDAAAHQAVLAKVAEALKGSTNSKDAAYAKDIVDYLSKVDDYVKAIMAVTAAGNLPPLSAAANDSDFKEAASAYMAQRKAFDSAITAAEADSTALSTALGLLSSFSDNFSKQAAAYYWNKFKWNVAFASGWGAADNEYKDLFTTGSQTWTTVSIPLISPSFRFTSDTSKFKYPQIAGLTLYGGLLWDSRTYKNGAYSADGNGFQAGGRLKYGSPVFNGFIEYLDKTTSLAGKSTSTSQYDLGFEIQIRQKQWVQFSIGNDLANSKGMLFGLNYGFNFSTSPTLQLNSDGTPAKAAPKS